MTVAIPPAQMERYKRTARARRDAEKANLVRRRAQAWTLARQAADLLRARYAAQRVVVFGSLAQPDRFTPWSDLDVAVWGLTASNWLQATAAVHELSSEIEVNLVDAACGSPELLAAIEREGVAL